MERVIKRDKNYINNYAFCLYSFAAMIIKESTLIFDLNLDNVREL